MSRQGPKFMEENLFMLAQLCRLGKHKEDPRIAALLSTTAGMLAPFLDMSREEVINWGFTVATERQTGLEMVKWRWPDLVRPLSERPGPPEGNGRRDLAIAALLEGASSETADTEALREQYGVESLEDAIRASLTQTDSANSSGSGWFDRWTWRSKSVFSGETELVQFLKLGVQDDVAIGWGKKSSSARPLLSLFQARLLGS
jgi:hypothetical protein